MPVGVTFQLCSLLPALLGAPGDEFDAMMGMSVEDILATPFEAASKMRVGGQKTGLRQAPGVVTLLTREDIQQAGARDLEDVLRLVPGVEFGVDTWGTIGIAFRGNWAFNGKVLLLIDGQPMNETLYLSLVVGHRFPADMIERVEVVRGPGSVVRGGMAELAVINVITLSADTLDGVLVTGAYGQFEDCFARRTAGVAYGQVFEETGLRLDAKIWGGQGRRSNRTYTDVYGSSFDMESGGRLDPLFGTVGAEWRGLRVRLTADRHRTTEQDGYDAVLPTPLQEDFDVYLADVAYELTLLDRITLRPRLTYVYHLPWRQDGDKALQLTQQGVATVYTNDSATLWQGGLEVTGAVVPDHVGLLLGASVAREWLRPESAASVELYGSHTIAVDTTAA